MDLYTKDGRPLQVSGETVYSQSGHPIGRIKENKVFATDGRYVGTIVGDRLVYRPIVYRPIDSVSIGFPFVAASRAGTTRANRVGSVILGDEPDIPD